MDPATSPSQPPATSPRRDEQDPRASLRHVLAADPSPRPPSPRPESSTPALPALPTLASKDSRDSQATPVSDSTPQNDNASITTSVRRNQSGTVSSVYSGNRIRYLKKDDGVPFWRRDIQFAFLKAVFEDQTRVFTKFSDATSNHTFAEIYVDAMAKSSKCSGILKEKLLSEVTEGATVPPALEMAMVCLLVNVGRMNTTVNFFPEMRARVRTFHPIPCLQARQGPMAYKQLQDGPRLKSILKGALEDTPNQPQSLAELKSAAKPRINPVSLIFMLAQFAPNISELHFPPSREFFDLFMRDTLTSKSRATAFLWILWWYLESNFTPQDSKDNPFGPGQPGADGVSIQVPTFETLTEDEAAKENEDPQDEIDFGEAKKKEREVILADDEPPGPTGKRGKNNTAPKATHVQIEPFRIKTDSSGWRAKRVIEAREGASFGDRTLSSGPTTPVPRFSAANMPHHLQSGDSGYSHHYHHSSPSEHHIPTLQHTRSRDSGDVNPYDDVEGGSRSRGGRSREPYLHQDPSEAIHDYDEASGGVRGYPYSTNATPSSRARGQYPQTGSQYESRPFPMASGTVAGRTDSGRRGASPHADSRPASGQPPTAQQLRLGKAVALIEQNLRDLQDAERQQRKRRGSIVDSWIKARSIPDGWSSDDDGFGRTGGLDDVNTSTGLAVNVKSSDGHESKAAIWNVGDAGQRAGELAGGLQRLCQILKKRDIKERNTWKSRVSGQKRKADTFFADDESVRRLNPAMPAVGFQAPTIPQFSQPFAPPIAPASRNGSISQQYGLDEDSFSATPEKKRRKVRGAKIPGIPDQNYTTERSQEQGPSRKTSTSSKADTAAPFNWVPKGRKRKDSDANGADPTVLRPGEMGIPRDVFFSPTVGGKLVETAATAGSTPRRRRTKSSGGVDRRESAATDNGRRGSEIDGDDVNMDQAPPNDVAREPEVSRSEVKAGDGPVAE